MRTELKPAGVATLEIHGEEFVLLPRAEYDRLRGVPADAVDAVAFGMQSLGRSLRLAREAAGLTQAELAKKLRRSQSMVSSAETGTVRVGQRYAAAVLRACGLPEDWKPARRM
mgnify:FL=1